MIRLVFWFAVLVGVTFGVTWLADSPGGVAVTYGGSQYEVSLGVGVLGLGLLFVAAMVVWGLFKWLIGRPTAFGGFFSRRREKKGRQALSSGLVAIGAGDEVAAQKAAVTALRLLPNDPLAQLLSAQSAQQQGDDARVKQVYREMSKSEDTKLLGLRGMFTQARREKNIDAARSIAKEALEENPGVSWASNAMLVSYASDKDWPAVLLLLDNQLKTKIIDKDTAQRKKAVVLTAQALAAEDAEPEAALDLATKAHKLDPSLVPAAIVAGRMNSVVGSLRKASRILEKTWGLTPHPDIAEVYAHLRPGDSVKDRQSRIKSLLSGHHGGQEGAVATAVVAISAGDWATAREVLNSYVNDQPSVRICTLMAEIETGELGDKGKAREWLAKAVHAPGDNVWTTQGFVVPEWMPVSPVNGELGAFEWKVPVKGLAFTESQRQEATAPFLIPDVADVVDVIEVAETADVVTIEAEEIVSKEKDSPKPDDVQKDDGDNDNKAQETQTKEKNKAKTTGKAAAVKTDKKEDKKNISDNTHRIPDDPGPKKSGVDKSDESWFG